MTSPSPHDPSRMAGESGFPGELIGSGRAADVYALGAERVLRRYRTPYSCAAEARLMTSCTAPKQRIAALAWPRVELPLVSESSAGPGLPLGSPLTVVAVTGLPFEIYPLICGGAKGTRTPGLLHAMGVRQFIHPLRANQRRAM
jgi:hypothetical protein